MKTVLLTDCILKFGNFICVFFLVAPHGMWDLFPEQGVNLCSLQWNPCSLNPWTTREVPRNFKIDTNIWQH